MNVIIILFFFLIAVYFNSRVFSKPNSSSLVNPGHIYRLPNPPHLATYFYLHIAFLVGVWNSIIQIHPTPTLGNRSNLPKSAIAVHIPGNRLDGHITSRHTKRVILVNGEFNMTFVDITNLFRRLRKSHGHFVDFEKFNMAAKIQKVANFDI